MRTLLRLTANGSGSPQGTVPRTAGLPPWIVEEDMLTGSLLWLLGVPIPVLILIWFFFLRGR